MKIKTFLLAGAMMWASALAINVSAQSVDAMQAVVVNTVPEAGSKDVQPGIVEIKVRFSKEMKNGSWSWATAWKDSTPEIVEKPHYEADHRTCVLKVKLEPNKTYGYWLNSQKFINFKDAGDRPAVPYLLTFSTAAQ